MNNNYEAEEKREALQFALFFFTVGLILLALNVWAHFYLHVNKTNHVGNDTGFVEGTLNGALALWAAPAVIAMYYLLGRITHINPVILYILTLSAAWIACAVAFG